MIELTVTQQTVIEAAIDRQDGAIHPLPKKLKGGSAKKVIKSLMDKGLVQLDDTEELRITDDAYRSVGQEPPTQEVEPDRKLRQGTKQSKIIKLLQQPEGATVEQIAKFSGWQNHYADAQIMPM